MTVQTFVNPLPTFQELNGTPLADGSVYFGLPNLDPIQYPKDVFWDEALAIPVSQPVRTTNGFLYRNGGPANVWADGSCSVLVQDSRGRQVYYIPDWSGIIANVVAAATAAATASAAAAAGSAVDAEAAAASASVFGSATQYVTWAELSAITGSGTQSAIVFGDTGTHTDPVVGGTVSNAGVYRWSASPAGWQRTADIGAVIAQDAAASHYFVQISGTPVPLGGYIAEKFARVASTIRRFAYDITGGPATVQVKVNGVVAHAAINASGRGEQDVTFTIPADATVDFCVTSGTPTYVWAMVDGSRP